jgi:hypothetical protein
MLMLPCTKAISGCFDAISHSYKAMLTSGGWFYASSSCQFYSCSNQAEAFWVRSTTSVAGASAGEATRLSGNPVTGDAIVVNLLLTYEEINAKVAELVDREFRELIEASVIETNLRLRESQLRTWRRNLILCVCAPRDTVNRTPGIVRLLRVIASRSAA